VTDTQKWQLLAVTVLLVALVYFLAPILTPFAFAALLAYLGDPVADRLEAWGLSRTLAVVVVFTVMVLVLVAFALLLVPMLERQIAYLIEQLPIYLAWFRDSALPWIARRLGVQTEAIANFDMQSIVVLLQEHWRAAGGFAATAVATLSKSGFAVIGWLVNALMVPVVTFYLLRDWDVLVARVHALVPRPVEPTVSRLARESDVVLGAFLRGQVSVMFALGVIYTIGLWAIGIDLALLIGMIAGAISFVPYLGSIVGLGAALIAAVVQYQDWMHVLLVCGVFGIGQMLEGMVLTPLLVGDRIGLHPVAVIFAVLAGGYLFGFLGILLALPVASVAMVVLRHVHERYKHSHLYGADRVIMTDGGEVVAVVPPPSDVVPPAGPVVTPSAPAAPASVSVTDAMLPPGTNP
jgi:predicted PurR-regulated permease PerM